MKPSGFQTWVLLKVLLKPLRFQSGLSTSHIVPTTAGSTMLGREAVRVLRHRVGVPYAFYAYDGDKVLEAGRRVFGREWRDDADEGARFWETADIPTAALAAAGLRVAYVTQLQHTASYDLVPVRPNDNRFARLFDDE